MTSRDFAYWLQGLFELADPKTLNEKQTELIKRHLNLVFIHEIDPSYSDDPEVQAKLQAIHDGTTLRVGPDPDVRIVNNDDPSTVDGPGVSPESPLEVESFGPTDPYPPGGPIGGPGTLYRC